MKTKYREIYEKIKHKKEVTSSSLSIDLNMSTVKAIRNLQLLEMNHYVARSGSEFADSGHEMYVYRILDQTRCDRCKTTGVRFYQKMLCKSCLLKEFKKIKHVIDDVQNRKKWRIA